MKKISSLILVVMLLVLCMVGCKQAEPATTTTPAPQTNTPSREYTAGTITKADYDVDTVMTHSRWSTLKDFEKYCTGLETLGLEKVYEKDTDVFSCAAFLDGEQYIYAYYTKGNSEVRVITGPKASFELEDCTADTGVTAEPSLTMIGQRPAKNNGQGFIFVLPDGRLILQDGGHYYHDGKEDLIYAAMKEVAPDPENIVIAAWFLSHAHEDHVGAFQKFVTDYSTDETVTIERVIFNFGAAESYDFLRPDGNTENYSGLVTDVLSLCRNNLPDTKVIKAHTGQVYDFGDAIVEIIYTVEDLLPAKNYGYVNATSLVIRVNVGGQSVLLLGDSTSASTRIMEYVWGSYLQADMVQLAHHGMWAGTGSFYQFVQGKVLLWPTNNGTVPNWLSDEPVMYAVYYAEDLYVADYNKLTTLKLPYETVKNKADVLAEFKK